MTAWDGLTMTTRQPKPLTQLLAAAGQGDEAAHEELWSVVYDELHGLARRQLAQEGPGHSRQPTSLVHEAYIRLTAGENLEWANRRQFFAAAAQAMRRIRIDYARRRKSLKRGGNQQIGPIQETPAVFDQDPAEVLAIDEALGKLEQEDSRKAEVVILRYFAGLTIEETANTLGLSSRTVDNEWRIARAWFYRELAKGDTTIR
jgi:RNA polymerase sigma factor (TIGR02999 family)